MLNELLNVGFRVVFIDFEKLGGGFETLNLEGLLNTSQHNECDVFSRYDESD